MVEVATVATTAGVEATTADVVEVSLIKEMKTNVKKRNFSKMKFVFLRRSRSDGSGSNSSRGNCSNSCTSH